MSEILQNTGVTLWSIRDDYDELQTSVFEALTGTGGKSNIRLIDEAIGNINSKLNGYYFEYSDDRLYICKKSENENIKRYPVTLNDNNGHIASKVDGSTITIDENGIVRGLPVDDALSSISTNPIQNKVVKAKVDEIEKNVSKNTEDISKNGTNISNNTQKITSLETAVSLEKTRAESVENQLKTDLENGKKVWDDKYTKSEVDNKLSTLETNIDWKEAVSTFDDIATTYPTPNDGWTVNVKDTDYTYRYNGTKWVAISANAIPKATNEVDGLMTKEYAKKLDGLTKYTPDGTTITADEDGTLHGADTIQVDGITITRDDATKVIALAKTLQDKIALVDNKIDKANVANNLTTTEADFVLDARQGKALQDQITSLNGSLNSKFQIINPDGITKNFYYEKSIGEVGGWFRFFKITYFSETGAQGAAYNHFNVTISQVFNNGLGGNCNFDIIEEYADNPYIIQRYNTLKQIKKFRIVRSGNIIYFDFYANSINNTTIVLINIPFYKNTSNISEASIVKYLIVPDVSDGEKIIKNTNLTTNN